MFRAGVAGTRGPVPDGHEETETPYETSRGPRLYVLAGKQPINTY